ncbi:MAG TPA: beta-ketoacyl synthase N-terminal-like domain-containing protein, partial [Steroidobacteraceae bacterium]|nr:beta-ketoacyl synthase N-terminal-like domain-containing protein [Steroidobacteraceae bacterium]
MEDLCWPHDLQSSLQTIKRRIVRYPSGQYLIERDGQILAAIFTQRIADTLELRKRCAKNVEELHRDAGRIVQLLAINVLPEAQQQRFGDQLLEFVLQISFATRKAAAVVGVTRCRNYRPGGPHSYEEYVAAKDSYGQPVDSMLKFHHVHGGVIEGVIEQYRPSDLENCGCGALVTYDVTSQLKNYANNAKALPETVQANELPLRLREHFVRAVCDLLDIPAIDELALDAPLMELGLNSADLLALSCELENTFGMALKATFFYEKNSCRKVLNYLSQVEDARQGGRAEEVTHVGVTENYLDRTGAEKSKQHSLYGAFKDQSNLESIERSVAVVGVAIRFPAGISTTEQFWNLLVAGESAIGTVPTDRWVWPSDIDPSSRHIGIDKGGFLNDVDQFDAAFFRVLPKEAEVMDPQHRIMLQLAWNCIEDAGIAAASLAGSRTGVFVGGSGSDYRLLVAHAVGTIAAHVGIGTSTSLLPNRVSYFLDLRGPSVQVDTACSSSLVAIHDAVQAIRAGTCDQALVGGVNVICHPAGNIGCYTAGMLAKDGQCKTFDARADGYVRSEGGAMVFLKPLHAA